MLPGIVTAQVTLGGWSKGCYEVSFTVGATETRDVLGCNEITGEGEGPGWGSHASCLLERDLPEMSTEILSH